MSSRKISRKSTITVHTDSCLLIVQNNDESHDAKGTNTKPFSTTDFIAKCVTGITVEPAPFLYSFGVMLYIPVLSNMCMNKLCRQYCGYSLEQCQAFDTGANKTVDLTVKQIWSEFEGISTVLGTIPSIIFSLFIGPWSDVFGRKAPIALPFVGTMLAVCMATLLYFMEWLPVWMLLLPNVLQTCFGGMASLLTGAFAYAADISSSRSGGGNESDSSRTLRMTLIEVGVVTGFAAGGIVGGALVGAGAAHVVCYVISFTTAMLGSLYIIIRIQETRRPIAQCFTTYEACTSLFKTRNIAASFGAAIAERSGHARRNLWLLLLALAVNSAVSMGEDGVMQKFLTGSPLHWPLSHYMFYQSLTIFCSMALVVCLIAVGKNVLHLHDATIGTAGCLSRICYSYSVAVAASTTWTMYTSTALGVGRYAIPVAIRALISKLVPRDEQGKVFSLVSTAEAVSPLIGTLAVTTIFTLTTQWWPGFFELVCALVAVIPLAMLCVVRFSSDSVQASKRRASDEVHDVGAKKPVCDETVRLYKISQTFSVHV